MYIREGWWGEEVPHHWITAIHGHLHKATRGVDTRILPLGHMSTQFRGAQISHDASMDRVRTGISQVGGN